MDRKKNPSRKANKGRQSTGKTTNKPVTTVNASNETSDAQANSTNETVSTCEVSHHRSRSLSPIYNYNKCGLNNIGNTCFMNSILQCLNNIPLLVQYYLKLKHKSPFINQNSTSKVFADLVDSMQKNSTARPNEFKSVLSRYAPRFQGYSQQDAHECLTATLDALHQESCEQTNDDEERSIITDLFQGQMEYTIKCSQASQCGNVTVTTDPFLDIPVFISSPVMFQVRLFLVNGEQKIFYFPFSSEDTIQSIISHLQRNVIVMGISPDNTFSVKYQPTIALSRLDDQSIIFYEIDEKNRNPMVMCLFGAKNENLPIPSCQYPPLLVKLSTKQFDTRLLRYLSQHFQSNELDYSIDDNPTFEPSIPVSLSSSHSIRTIVINLAENTVQEFQSKLRTLSKESKSQEQQKYRLRLKECLRKDLNAIERNSLNSAWYCSQCQQNRQITKENRILSLPQVLIIHLKRFNMESPPPRMKIDTFVDYPRTLDMTEFLSANANEKQIYDLNGVSVHSGSLEGGHYNAYTKKDSTWFCCNDSWVEPVHDERVITGNAYILFYSKRV